MIICVQFSGGNGFAFSKWSAYSVDQWTTLFHMLDDIHSGRWGTHLYISLFPSIHPSVFCAPYLRNHTSSNHNFWCTCVKWWYLQAFFYFFEILIFWAVREVKGQKIAQNDKTLCLLCFISHYPLWKGKKCSKMRKNYVCHAPYLKKRTSYDFHLWYICVGWYLQAFHSFFQNFDFLGC